MRGEFNMNDIFVYPLQNSKEYKDIIQDEIDKYCIKNNKIISNKIYTNK